MKCKLSCVLLFALSVSVMAWIFGSNLILFAAKLAFRDVMLIGAVVAFVIVMLERMEDAKA